MFFDLLPDYEKIKRFCQDNRKTERRPMAGTRRTGHETVSAHMLVGISTNAVSMPNFDFTRSMAANTPGVSDR